VYTSCFVLSDAICVTNKEEEESESESESKWWWR